MSLQLADAFVGRWGSTLSWAIAVCWALTSLAAIARGILNPASRRWWLLLSALTAAIALEMPLGLRFQVMGMLRSALKSAGHDYYMGRRPVQGAMIAGGLLIAAGLAAWAWSAATRVQPGCKLALAGACLGWAGIAIETTSLHQIDVHYSIYWTIWWTGLALTVAGLAWGGKSARADETFHVDSAGKRLVRLSAAVVLLSIPEVIDLIWSGLGG
jgi:hypothetical protein